MIREYGKNEKFYLVYSIAFLMFKKFLQLRRLGIDESRRFHH